VEPEGSYRSLCPREKAGEEGPDCPRKRYTGGQGTIWGGEGTRINRKPGILLYTGGGRSRQERGGREKHCSGHWLNIHSVVVKSKSRGSTISEEIDMLTESRAAKKVSEGKGKKEACCKGRELPIGEGDGKKEKLWEIGGVTKGGIRGWGTDIEVCHKLRNQQRLIMEKGKKDSSNDIDFLPPLSVGGASPHKNKIVAFGPKSRWEHHSARGLPKKRRHETWAGNRN